MSMVTRRLFYGEVVLDDLTRELDYLDTEITEIDLPTRTKFRVTNSTEGRPDLISYKFFGNFHMGWLISLHNGFLDPFEDYYTGRLIKIPDMDAYYRFYNTHARGT